MFATSIGFRLSGNERRFTVRRFDLTSRTFKVTPAGVAEHKRVAWEPADLAAYARSFATKLGNKDEDDFGFYLAPETTSICWPSQPVRLSTCCSTIATRSPSTSCARAS